MRTANIVAAPMDIVMIMEDVRRREIVLSVRIRFVVGVPTHRSATLERTVHLEVERSVGEIRPVSSVLLESSRQ